MLYIDITRLVNNNTKHLTGVDRVSLAYIQHYKSMACAVLRLPQSWIFFPYSLSIKIFENLLTQQPIIFLRKTITKKYYMWRYKFPKQGEKNYLLHTSHSGLEKSDFATLMAFYHLQGIYFLHDLIPIDYPEYCREGELQKHQRRLKNMAEAALVICNSYYTYERWVSYCQNKQLFFPKSIIAHLAVEERWHQLTINSLSNASLLHHILPHKPYFVILGTIEARKNHLLILNIWRILVQQLGEACPILVIIGKRGWECEQVFDILDRSIELRPVILELNTITDAELPLVLKKAQALLFPSFVEGFGLPLIEAFKAGIPVIASDIAAFREINQDIAPLISPFNTYAWLEEVKKYLTIESPARQEQIKKIHDKNLAFTWETHFKIVDSYIISLLEDKV